jgi:hypothetical protein
MRSHPCPSANRRYQHVTIRHLVHDASPCAMCLTRLMIIDVTFVTHSYVSYVNFRPPQSRGSAPYPIQDPHSRTSYVAGFSNA